jgi:hypothetical protein
MRELNHIISKLIQTYHDKGIAEKMTDRHDIYSIMLDVGELGGEAAGIDDSEGRCIEDNVGNILVNLIYMCERNGTSLETCLNKAYNKMGKTYE